MAVRNAQRIDPSGVAWEQFHDPHGRPTTPVRVIKANDPYLIEADFPPDFRAGLHWHPYDTIYLFTAGEMRIGEEGRFHPGDVRWVRGGHVYGPEEAGSEGVRFFLASLGGDVGLNWADLVEVPAAIRTRLARFPLACGRETLGSPFWVPLFLTEDECPGVRAEAANSMGPAIGRLRIRAGGRLPAHWFDHDALLFLRRGSVTVAGEGTYGAGEFRAVTARLASGPLVAGAEGADLLALRTSGEGPLALAMGEPG